MHPHHCLQAGVILLDLDYKFSFPRLHQLLECQIREATTSLADTEVAAVLTSALKRLTVAQVADSNQFVVSPIRLRSACVVWWCSAPHLRPRHPMHTPCTAPRSLAAPTIHCPGHVACTAHGDQIQPNHWVGGY
jgi:hypothetical protein